MPEDHVTREAASDGHDRGCAHVEGDPRRQQDELHFQMLRIRQKLLVLSGKGGVGKSTVAVNLATALADAGRRVGLLDVLDVDLHGPSVRGLLGIDYVPQPGRACDVTPAKVGRDLWATSIQFFLPEEDAVIIWRGPRKHSAIRQMLAGVDWGHIDCLVVDAPPGTGDEALALVEMLGAGAGAVVVSTPQSAAGSDVRKALTFCRTLDLPVLGVIENMSGFVCPHCGETTDILPSGAAEATAAGAGVPFLGHIPIDLAVVQARERGVPLVRASGESRTTAAFSAAIEPLLTPTERPAHSRTE